MPSESLDRQHPPGARAARGMTHDQDNSAFVSEQDPADVAMAAEDVADLLLAKYPGVPHLRTGR